MRTYGDVVIHRRPGSRPTVSGVAVAVVGALLAASCASGGDESAGADPPATADAIDYGQQYLDAVAPSNCASVALSAAFEPFVDDGDLINPEPWSSFSESVLPAYREFADALTDLAASLTTSDWPDEVADDIDQLVAEAGQDASAARAASEATNVDEWSQTLEQFTVDSTTAGTVRAQLGLPRNTSLDLDCD